MILSVPHTGTRTLQSMLEGSQFYHFGQNESAFEDKHEPVDFPVRDPLDTIISWHMYEGYNNNNEGCRRYELAINYLANYEHGVVYYKMENFPVLEGIGPNRDHEYRQWVLDKDIEKLKTLDDVVYLLEWLKKPNIKRFFNIFYQDRWYECDNWENSTDPDSLQATCKDGQLIVC